MSAADTTTTVKGAITGLSAAPAGAAETASNAGGSMTGAVDALANSSGVFTWGGYFQALAVLFLIVAILFAALWFLKRKGGIKLLTGQGDLSLESRLALGPKKSLVVVRFLNKRVLLGVTDQQITMLTELPTDENDATRFPPEAANNADFKAHFDQAVNNGSVAPD